MNHQVTLEEMKNRGFSYILTSQSTVKGCKQLVAIVNVKDCCVVYEIRYKENCFSIINDDGIIPANNLEEAVNLYNNIELNKGE